MNYSQALCRLSTEQMQKRKETLTLYPSQAHAWRVYGDVACDAIHLLLKLSGRLVSDNAYWVDTSLAATEKAKFLLFVQRLRTYIDNRRIESSDIQPISSSVEENPDEISETGLQWLYDLVLDWNAPYLFNLVFVILKEHNENGVELNTVELEATDLCSDRKVKVDPNTIFDSTVYQDEGWKERVYVTYTTMREVQVGSSLEYQISGLTIKPKANFGVYKFKSCNLPRHKGSPVVELNIYQVTDIFFPLLYIACCYNIEVEELF